MTIYDVAGVAMFLLAIAACLRGMRWAAKPVDPPQAWLLSDLDRADGVKSWLDLPHQSRHGAEIAELEAMWRR